MPSIPEEIVKGIKFWTRRLITTKPRNEQMVVTQDLIHDIA